MASSESNPPAAAPVPADPSPATTEVARTSPCCPDGALPELLVVQDDYKPKGQRLELPAVEAAGDGKSLSPCQIYVTGDSTTTMGDDTTSNRSRSILILWCDAFGPWSGTHRKIADELTTRIPGLIVVLPDPFGGNGGLCPQIVTGFLWNGRTFLKKYPWETHHQLVITKQLIPFVETKFGDDGPNTTKFAMMGMCYGTWLTLKSCCDETIASRITCAIHYHPSIEILEKTTFGRDDIALCRNLQAKIPQMIHATKNESTKWKPNGAAHKALLEENSMVSEIQFTLAPKTQSHGFMTRVDVTSDKVGREAVKEGLDMAQSFLEKYNT